MRQKVLGGILIVFSTLLFTLSLIGVGSAWYYNEPLTNQSIAKLTEADDELEQAQNAIKDAQDELTRALRMVESAEESLESYKEQREEAVEFLDAVNGLLDDKISPSLETSKEKLAEVQEMLDDLYEKIEALNKIPFVEFDLPEKESLSYFVELTDTLEEEINNVGEMADTASTFLDDATYLLGGDLSETKENIQNLMVVLDEYEAKIDKWRTDIAQWTEKLPRWFDITSASIAIFLLWFAFSQIGLLLHALAMWRNEEPLDLKAKRTNTIEDTK